MSVIAQAAIAVVTTVAKAIGAFKVGSVVRSVAKLALPYALAWGFGKLFGAKAPVAQRQADITTLSIGEVPRAAIFGTLATGGSLDDAFNYGNDNEWEALVIHLADHECHSLLAFWVGDQKYTFTANGVQTAFNDGSTPCLELYWQPGTLTQTVPSILTTNAPTRWASSDRMFGCSYVVAAYRKNDKIFPTGRPNFLWEVKGGKWYDPRKDSTVDGGSGAHRWADQSTWEYSDNAKICEYNWRRGVWTNGQLLVGPGRSDAEAPPADVIAPANVCDEDVALKAGGTEKRYRVAAYIDAATPWRDTLDDFALAMGGEVVDRRGVMEAAPGAAQTPYPVTIEDHMILEADGVEFEKYRPRSAAVNAVSARYVDPAKMYNQHSAPVRVDAEMLAAHGEPRELALELAFVTSRTQAQRIQKIMLEKARRERTARFALGPRFMGLEAGDWVRWRSRDWLDGDTVTFTLPGVEQDGLGETAIELQEIDAACFEWNAASDELDETGANQAGATPPGAATLSGFDLTAVVTTGAAGAQTPMLQAVWNAPNDITIKRIRIEYRKQGETDFATVWSHRPAYGLHRFGAGLASGATYEARLIPETNPERAVTATAWDSATIGTLTAGAAKNVPWSGVQDDDGFRPEDDADVTLTHTAAAITGQGWGATASEAASSNALVPADGVNRLRFSEFDVDTTSGWSIFQHQAGAWTGSSGFANDTGRRRHKVDFTSASTGYVGSIFTPSAARVRVTAGERIAYGGEFETTGVAVVDVIVQFYNAAGSSISSASFTVAGSTAFGTRQAAFATVPANAVRAQFEAATRATSAGAGSGVVMRPFIAGASASQTVAPPYSRGLDAYEFADVTSANTAAAFTGQKSGATTQFSAQSSAPSSPANGDYWADTSTSPPTLKQRISGAWVTLGAAIAGATVGGVKEDTNADNATNNTTHVEVARVALGGVAAGGRYRVQASGLTEPGETAISSGSVFNGAWEIIETSTAGSAASGTVIGAGDWTCTDTGGGEFDFAFDGLSGLGPLMNVNTAGARDIVMRVWRASGSNNVTGGFTVILTVEYIPPAS